MIIERLTIIADKIRKTKPNEVQIESRKLISISKFVSALWIRLSIEKKIFYFSGFALFITSLIGFFHPFWGTAITMLLGVFLLICGRDVAFTQKELTERYGL